MPICPKCRGENPELGAKCPRDGYYYIHDDAIDDAEKDDWIGRLAAEKYVILSLISEGGMGAVYRAMQLPVQREVAFKVLRAELQDSDQGQDRFAREARAVSRLMHPNIITMHDFGVDENGHPFMVMEYAPGKSLADWIMQPGLKLDRIAHVFRQILSALSEAHEQGIVHRDLKPENLIVTRTGSDKDYIKLLDFGIARMVHDGATRGLTKEGEVFGTPHYMAPEQAQGKKDIGPPADVYALGIMLYELLSGECPFDAPTPLSILYMHINDDLPELEPRNGVTVPGPIQEVIDRATAKNAEDRFATAGEMLAAFDRALGNAGSYIAPAGTSSEVINTTQKMGSQVPAEQVRAEKATADTLHFEDAKAQRFTDSSNAVPVNDPSQSGTMTAEMEALAGTNATKYVMIAAALAVLLGVGAALLLTGDETSEQASEPAEPVAGQQDEDPAPAGDEEQATAREPEVATKEGDEPAEAAPEANEPAAADDGEVDSPAEGDKPKTVVARPEKTTAKPGSTKTKRPERIDDSQTKTTKKTEEPPAKKTRPSTTETSSGSKDKADEPEKFQPKKFERPAPKDSDEEPKKFEPKKWR